MDDTIDDDTSTSISWKEPKKKTVCSGPQYVLLGPPTQVGTSNKFYWDEI